MAKDMSERDALNFVHRACLLRSKSRRLAASVFFASGGKSAELSRADTHVGKLIVALFSGENDYYVHSQKRSQKYDSGPHTG